MKRLVFGAVVAAALGLAVGSLHHPTQSPSGADQAGARLPGPSLMVGADVQALDAAG